MRRLEKIVINEESGPAGSSAHRAVGRKHDVAQRKAGIVRPTVECAACDSLDFSSRYSSLLLFVEVFLGHVVFGQFTGANFLPLAISGLFDTGHNSGFECVAFFQQFINTLGICAFDVG